MIFIAIGSNLRSNFGDRFDNINLAIKNIEDIGIKIVSKSSYYESLSYPNKNDPKFINIVISITSELSVTDLMSYFISIENKLERKREKKNDPRTCDIDIIDFKGEVLNFKLKDAEFNSPHKKMIYRNFVLFPLKEISPNWIHPFTKENIDTLIQKLSNEDKKSILKINKN